MPRLTDEDDYMYTFDIPVLYPRLVDTRLFPWYTAALDALQRGLLIHVCKAVTWLPSPFLSLKWGAE